ncbi:MULTISPECIES: ATP-binding cassette domain-containing protein [Mycobacteriaceae]|uniref:ATP-binding cassette, subfamily B n=1 Tax=Mycolicibacterium fluoranthenivorans TaxID=258505 RepID=A0A1G4VTK8_9MYCO|nr:MULTISPECIES: ABC transporter ATP-binding protein [Mycobacteriaceae]MCV7251783.1 ABC transporter ATP-binding protein [Mycobacterium hackensackense]SCX11152.1 ATP-binding cassette, subfamily B [Mycolicibacterium fluoranthenivorans]
MTDNRKIPPYLLFAWRLLVSLRKRDWSALLLLAMMLAAAPLATLFIIQFLVDYVAGHQGSSFTIWSASIWVPILIYFFINVVADSAETLQLLQITLLRDQIAFEIERRTLRKTLSHHDLGVYDDKELKALQTLANDATADGQYLIQLVSNMLTGLLLVVPTLAIAGSLGLWIPLLILATTVPATLMQLRYEGKSWDVEQEYVGLNNRIQETRSSMLNPRFAVDIRTYLMHIKLLPRWTSDALELLRLRRGVRTRGAYLVLGLALISGFGLLIPYGYVIQKTLAGDASVGTLALFIGLIPELRRSLFIVFGNASEIVGAAKQLDGLREYESTVPRIELDPTAPAVNGPAEPTPPAIELQNVGFGYASDGSVKALNDITLSLEPGSSTLVVGANGAGKTTVSKLVSRLYDPSTGVILFNGSDLRNIPILEHRRRTAVLAQDPARLPLSFRDALTFDVPDATDDELEEVLQRVGLGDKLTHATNGLDTELSTTLNAGVDLSGGQWQRLAIARFFLALPHKNLAVIDEPTTALDPVADRRLSMEILERCRGKTTVIVSHRLHIAPHVDRVVLMKGGQIVASGPHSTLLNTTPDYFEMFSAADDFSNDSYPVSP